MKTKALNQSLVMCSEKGFIYNIGEVLWKPNGDSFLEKCECLASHSGSSFSCQTCKFK